MTTKTFFTETVTRARLAKLRAIEARDHARFRVSPLGQGFLSRRERYNEVCWELESRLQLLAIEAEQQAQHESGRMAQAEADYFAERSP